MLARLGTLSAPEFVCALASALGEGVRRAGSSLGRSADEANLRPILRQALDLLQNAGTPEESRIAAVQTLSQGPFSLVREPVGALLAAGQPAELQRAAVGAFSSYAEPVVANDLLNAWDGLTPALRSQVVEALLRRPERLDSLLAALESGKLRPTDLTAGQLDALRNRPDGDVAERARRILGRVQGGARADVVKEFSSSLTLGGDPVHGRTIYLERCASCHRLAGEGNALGPDLESVRTNGKEALLNNLIDPNREVMPKYVNYAAETRDGESWTGLVALESESTVVLRQPNGSEVTLLRSALASFRSLGQSAMPEGLEQGLRSQALADLMEYVLSARSH
jgi:putative heme-binding domain-containing protein